MEDRSASEDPLNKLTDGERLVLDEICRAFRLDQRNLTAREIAARLFISEGEARRRLGKIYEKLEISGEDTDKRFQLIYRFCLQREEPPPHAQILVEVPLSEEESPPRTQEKEIRRQSEELSRRRGTQRVDESPPGPRLRGPIFGILLILLIGAVLLFLFRDRILPVASRETPAVTPLTELAILPPENIAGTDIAGGPTIPPSPEPTFTHTVLPYETALYITAVSFGTEIASYAETKDALYNPTSTPSPSPSNTPSNTSTPAASPTPENILFEDKFDNGYKDEWEVYGGEPHWTDGKLTSNSFTWMIVGDPSWKDYIIEFDVSNNGQGAGNIVGVRIQDVGNMMGLIFGGGAVWAEFRDGIESRIGNTDFVVDTDPFHFKIIVQGDNYTVEGKKSFGYKSYQQGKVGFRIHPGVLFDNFIVRPIP